MPKPYAPIEIQAQDSHATAIVIAVLMAQIYRQKHYVYAVRDWRYEDKIQWQVSHEPATYQWGGDA